MRLILVGVSMLAVFLFAGEAPHFVDDTFISLQYARVLVNQGELTWHLLLDPVDGFTSLAHVLLLAAGSWLGFGLIGWNSFLILLSTLSLLAMFAWATRNLSPWAAGAGLAVIASNTALLFWIGAGLDAVLYAAAFFAAYLSFEVTISKGKMRVRNALILVFLGMMRPEGLFIAVALLAAFWVLRRKGPVTAPSTSIIATATVLVAFAAVTIWRIGEYGYPLPNTYYAKMSATHLLEAQSGLSYLADWFRDGSGFLLVFTFVALALGSRVYIRALFILGQLAVVVLAGGDTHPAFRFFLPVLPLVAMDIAWVIDHRRKLLTGIAITCVALFVSRQADITGKQATLPNPVLGIENMAQGHWPMDDVEDDPWSKLRADAAREISEVFPDDVAIAATDVGILAFFSGMPVLDALGLNHPVISHLPKPENQPTTWGNNRLDYLMDRDAPLVHIYFPAPSHWTFEQVISSPESCDRFAARVSVVSGPFERGLDEHYLCVSIPSRYYRGEWINLFVNRDRVDLLESLPEGSLATSCIRRFRASCQSSG